MAKDELIRKSGDGDEDEKDNTLIFNYKKLRYSLDDMLKKILEENPYVEDEEVVERPIQLSRIKGLA